ncbi:hypothetical protein PHLCEN_2v2512 [Hermanssonia centrifuga]|uniref:Uncharacterized protein n=1 Tax=Hermanssonia centrifuga TaxID=98765 RepID=A0A2R6RLN4_9APHY|nr:hypothetical protein PHLCEN_2v2512 [Hermanssonia centrifuga]
MARCALYSDIDLYIQAAPSFLPPLPPLSAVNSLLPPLPPASSLFPSLPPASSLFPSLPPISSLLPSLPPPGSILPPLPSSLLPPLSNSSASTNSGDNTNLGAIIGGVVGGFCGFVLLLAAFLFWFFRRRLLGRTAYGGSEADLAAKEAADGYRGSSEKTVDVASPRDPRFQMRNKE